MTQEDKELLLRDLCARLPYGGVQNDISEIKPYLLPLSSMTEEEIRGYKHPVAFSGSPNGAANFIDWLNAHHFDYRDLIEKELALETLKGMLKFIKRCLINIFQLNFLLMKIMLNTSKKKVLLLK